MSAATASSARLLCIPRTDTDDQNAFVLLRARPSSRAGSNDLYLQATEGENAYGVKVRRSHIHKLLHKTYTASPAEFATILYTLLLRQPLKNEADRSLLEGVGFSAGIEDGLITVAVRKSVGGIKQRIATIEIPQTEDDISLYDWVGESCQARDDAEARLKELETKAAEKEQQVEKLISQLRDLAALKKEHEDAVHVKFQELLNSKKSQIRELNRILEAQGKVEDVKEETQPPPQAPKSARKGKNPRKRPATPVDEDESDGGFGVAADRTDDEEQNIDPNQLSDHRTTEDEAEASTSGDELPIKPKEVRSRKQPARRGKGRAKATGRNTRKKSPAPAKGRGGRSTRAGSKQSEAAPVASKGRGRTAKAATPPTEAESEEEKQASPKTSQHGGNDSDATGGETDDDEL